MFYTVPFSSTVTESVRLGEDVISSDAFINSIHTQCPEIDFSFVLKKAVPNFESRSWSYYDHFFVQMKSNGDATVVTHEFSHSFGRLKDEYYEETEGAAGNAGEPNCLPTEDEARRVWGPLVGVEEAERLIAQARVWNAAPSDSGDPGCGGICDSRCNSYFRPRFNSIMRHNGAKTFGGEPGGDTFNDVSRVWLENKLKAIA
ncbi:MAG: M64 family metallopeptidase [Nanoarchaeota archaeon]